MKPSNRLYIICCILLAGLLCAFCTDANAQGTKEVKTPTATPAEVKVAKDILPEVKLLQVKSENLQLRQQLLIQKLKETPEWTELADALKKTEESWQTLLLTTLTTAGVKQDDITNYTYNKETFTFTRKSKPTSPEPEKK